MGYYVKEEWQKKKNQRGHTLYMYALTGWATRFRKRGKKKEKIQGGRVKVLGGLLG